MSEANRLHGLPRLDRAERYYAGGISTVSIMYTVALAV